MPEPVRTCAGCRQRAAKTSLLRLVNRQGVAIPDPDQAAPGRGVYLHRDLVCLERAVKRRTLGRALRGEIDGGATAEAVRQHLGGTGREA